MVDDDVVKRMMDEEQRMLMTRAELITHLRRAADMLEVETKLAEAQAASVILDVAHKATEVAKAELLVVQDLLRRTSEELDKVTVQELTPLQLIRQEIRRVLGLS